MNSTLSDSDRDILDTLQEEMGEAIQVISKLKRFGPQSYHPDDPARTSNAELVEQELGDVLGMIEQLKKSALVSEKGLEAAKAAKIQNYAKWSTKHQTHNLVPAKARIEKFQGGYSVVLWTDKWVQAGAVTSRLTNTAKSFYGQGAKTRAIKWAEENGLEVEK